MKPRLNARLLVAAAAAGVLISPGAAHAGAAEAICRSDGLLLIESTDTALTLFPHLWDFEVRSVIANGTSVSFRLSSGTNDFEQYTVDSPIPAGQVVAFEFRQVRNLREGGDGFASVWTTHVIEAPLCAPPPTTTTATTSTTTGSTTTTSGSTTTGPPVTSVPGPTTTSSSVTGSDPTLVPSIPRRTTVTGDLPETGSQNSVLLGAALGLIAVGLVVVVIGRRTA